MFEFMLVHETYMLTLDVIPQLSLEVVWEIISNKCGTFTHSAHLFKESLRTQLAQVSLEFLVNDFYMRVVRAVL